MKTSFHNYHRYNNVYVYDDTKQYYDLYVLYEHENHIFFLNTRNVHFHIRFLQIGTFYRSSFP